jgi:DNA repair exonuclease SbcCD nuclease subunit
MPAGLTLSEKAQKDVAELLECSTDEFGGMCAFTDGHHKINIACIPGLNRSALLTREEFQGKDPREIHRIMTDKITGIAQGLLAARDETNWPTVLLSHITYSEADTGFDHLLLEHEPLLTPEAVEGFDLVCLGHIHRPQKINGKVFYCGAPERHSFNDEHVTPGFWIHEMTGKGQPVESRFIETPARRFVTLDITSASVDASRVRGLNERGHDPLIEDAVIRVRLQAPEEVGKLLDRKEIEKEFYKDGAYFVQEIKIDAERTDRSRDETVTESLAPIEALEKWSEQQGIGKDEIRELISMAGELLAEGVA